MVSSQRPPRLGAVANGDAQAPPSTIAAQIVQNHAPEQAQDPRNRELFGQLLRNYLIDPSSEDVDLGLSAQLISVVCKAGLDVLLHDDPFGGAGLFVDQAIDSLSVIQLTVQKTPELMFFVNETANESPNPPLFVWLFPKLLALLGRPRLDGIQDSIGRLIVTFPRILVRSTQDWRKAQAFLDVYRACINEIVRALKLQTSSAQTVSSSFVVELPPAESISSLWPAARQLVALPRGCQLSIKDTAQALAVAFTLFDAVDLSKTFNRPSESPYAGFLNAFPAAHVSWGLDTLQALWRRIKLCGEHFDPDTRNYFISKYLERLKTLCESVLLSRGPFSSRAALLYLNAHADLLSLCVGSGLGETAELITAAYLLDLLSLSLFNPSIRNFAEEVILPTVRRICADEKQFIACAHDLQLVLSAWLIGTNVAATAGTSAKSSIRELTSGNEELFHDDSIRTRYAKVHRLLTADTLLDSRPAKRRKAPLAASREPQSEGFTYDNIVNDLTHMFLGEPQKDLAGMSEQAGDKFSQMSMTEKQAALSLLARVACSESGSLRLSSGESLTKTRHGLERGRCRICDDSSATTNIAPALGYENSEREIMRTLLIITATSGFPSSNSIRGLYCAAFQRVLQHSTNADMLTLRSLFGQWCLKSLRSSSRELRIAAGHALTVFLHDRVPEPIRKQNRLGALDFMRRLSEQEDTAMHETIIHTLRQIAKVCGEDELNIVLLQLVELLGHTNPVICGVAYSELGFLSADLDKTPEDMFRPFWRTIAVTVAKDACTRPQKIQQLCDQLLGMGVKQFLVMTQVYTLPYLIWTKNKDVLQKITDAGSTTVGQLCANNRKNLAAVLAFLLLRTPPNNEQQVLDVLCYAAPEFTQYDLSGLVQLDPVTIACEMLKSAADEDSRRKPEAHQSIEQLATLVEMKPGKPVSRSTRARSSFFSTYVLGIMAHFSDVIDALRVDQLLSERKRCLRAIKELVIVAGHDISVALPQVRACLQSALEVPELRDEAFSAWATLVDTLSAEDMESMLEHTFSVVAQNWDQLSSSSQDLAVETVRKIIKTHSDLVKYHMATLPSLASIPRMATVESSLKHLRSAVDVSSLLEGFVRRCQDETGAVVVQALRELVPFLEAHQTFVHEAAIAQPPSPLVFSLCRSVLDASVKFAEGHHDISILCARALGIIGCLDPYRADPTREKKDVLVLENFESTSEVVDFVVFLLETVIVKAFHSATNARAQGFLAYAMQELLAFCDFRQLDAYNPRSSQAVNPVYQRWIRIPETIRSTLTPFLSSYYKVTTRTTVPQSKDYPLFSPEISYGTWLRAFVLDLLHRGKGDNAQMMFSILARIIQGHDLSIPRTMLPVTVLNLTIGGNDDDSRDVVRELLTVLQYPLREEDPSVSEMVKLCSESVLRVIDYLGRWLQKKRKTILDARAKAEKDGRGTLEIDEERAVAQISSVERVLTQLSAETISNRAVACGSYAQALFHWENHIRQRKELAKGGTKLPIEEQNEQYQHLQDIYAKIDEPDGMEGVSVHLQVLDPDQQILEHKKAGRWAAVQNWYELELAKDPANISLQTSLLTCLREAGQYDSLLNYVERFQRTLPSSLSKTLPFAAEASWVSGKWESLERFLQSTSEAFSGDFNVGIGKALLALRRNDCLDFTNTIASLRESVARGLTSSTTSSLQACHDQLLRLHVLYEIEAISGVSEASPLTKDSLLKQLDGRLEVLGAFPSDKQYLLGLRRASMQLSRLQFSQSNVASTWLTSAKLARKGKLMNNAFNAVLHATQLGEDAAKIEHSRVLWAEGQHRKAIQMLGGAISTDAFHTHSFGSAAGEPIVIDGSDVPGDYLAAKAHLLMAKWLDKAGQTQSAPLKERFRHAVNAYPKWEKGQFYLGAYYIKILEADRLLPLEKQGDNNHNGDLAKHTIECFTRSMGFGSKYYNQTVPKVITLWLELGMEVHRPKPRKNAMAARIDTQRATNLDGIHQHLRKYVEKLPAFIFYTAFTQIITRISHPNPKVFEVLMLIITKVISCHPQQALWSLYPVIRASDEQRRERGIAVVNKLKEVARRLKNDAVDLKSLLNQGQKLTDQLLQACDFAVEGRVTHASLQRDLGFRHSIAPCALVVPVEANMIATLPTIQVNSQIRVHKAFPASRTVTISSFADDVLVLSSLQRPRKITVRGSDGINYGLLCKPKDDLRKDQRLMEFNTEIGRALKRDVESRKRGLYIHTYGVTPLNEECGTIEWVDGLKPMRDIIMDYYRQKNVRVDYTELRRYYGAMAEGNLAVFKDTVQPKFFPVLHEWFVETFPDPEAWFTARLRYTRTCAVMSIVGHILGLGDRHGENVLLEQGNGGVFHVDFNCLFDKGLTFEKPELVPFRLTENMVDAFGAYGTEGPFRIAAEITLRILRNSTPTLMTILETFLYDPTADFVSKKKNARTTPGVPDTPQAILDSVRAKLKGLLQQEAVPLGVEGYVDVLILQATDWQRLAKMYIGWCAYF